MRNRGPQRYPSMDQQDDMARRLRDALREVEECAFHMNRAIDANNLEDAIKFAQNMLRELRAGTLSPRPYYELWMKIFDYLRQLHAYFLDVNSKGVPMEELYRKVQASNFIIPRLYLMITTGSAFLISQEASSQEILTDLIEMTKGVQHPLRGLFLRNYLLKMTQDKLTDDFGVSTEFAVSFVLQNFGEMNRLWVRMQHQGNPKTRARREKERQDLKVLISFNLVRLSEFDGMTLELYQSRVLGQILDLVTNCKDKIAQQYLVDVLVQVFPARYQLATLETLFGSFEHLEPDVDLKSVLESLMDRIKYFGEEDEEDQAVSTDEPSSAAAQNEPTPSPSGAPVAAEDDVQDEASAAAKEEEGDEVDVNGDGEGAKTLDGADADVDADADAAAKDTAGASTGEASTESRSQTVASAPLSPSQESEKAPRVSSRAYELINGVVAKTIAGRTDMNPENVLELHVSMLDFVVACYPGELNYISSVLGFCAEYLEKQADAVAGQNLDPLVMQLLRVPLKQKELSSLDILELVHYPNLMARLEKPESKMKVAHWFLQHVLADPDLRLSKPQEVNSLLAFIAPLVSNPGSDTSGGGEHTAMSAAFEAQQQSVARFLHRLDADDPATFFELLGTARKQLSKGGVNRIRFTLLPLSSRYIALAERIVAARANTGENGDHKGNLINQNENGEDDDDDDDDDLLGLGSSKQGKGDAVSLRKVFQILHEIASVLGAVVELQQMALRVFLQAALCADRAGEQEIAYELMVQAFTLYEDVADSKEQVRTLPILIGTVMETRGFDKDNYETLCTKLTQYAARLLRKPDQCHMVLACSHLFWHLEPKRPLREGEDGPPAGQDTKRAHECLQRALRIADSCMTPSTHVALFVHILNRFLYFFDAGMEKVTAEKVSNLIALVKQNLDEIDTESEERSAAETHFANTIAHARALKEKQPEKYSALDLSSLP
ncbi:Vacuolar protein sorting-associated protein 35 [Hondaea fermentalgiana]|uniref:Vacuolar protein sorting-associated protein 35 n=1 Tax=Hondaea fermentalgiana TaxID=2315210 RepID=A0A2R5G2Y1_9STRA|nr:Vacuolar protein sorting-associated protein 35 [Hondaea fermentalgiana]|eukprot:GBG24088.1 Vacuolar protein sorting-associated protein 35 [Hondaea fermentalgiana]